MAVVIDGSNTPTAGGVVYGDGTEYASTAAGSAGGVLYSAGSSAPAFTAAGTSGQILQSNGASAPSWVAAPGGGSWIYLSTVTASGAATADIDYTFDSTYDMYAIVAENVSVSTDTSNVFCRMKFAGAYLTNSTYRSLWIAANDFSATTTFGATGGTATGIQTTNSVSNNAAATMGFVAYLPVPYSTSKYKAINISGVYTNATPAVALMGVGAYNTTTSALQGVRFYPSAGTITGTFRLYGIKNS